MIMTVMPMMMLSGGMSPVESQPQWIQYTTWLLPSHHDVSFMQAIVYRGADFNCLERICAGDGRGVSRCKLAFVSAIRCNDAINQG
jgi:hypothetical protein